MATYAVGDIQGCFHSFQALLKKIHFNPSEDKLWLVGDLINRGSGSLEVLRWVFDHQSSVFTVLGNHARFRKRLRIIKPRLAQAAVKPIKASAVLQPSG